MAERQKVQDGQWRPAVIDACLARQSKNGMRMENRVQRAVQLSQRVVDGRGGWDMDSEGGGSRKKSNGVTGIIDKI